MVFGSVFFLGGCRFFFLGDAQPFVCFCEPFALCPEVSSNMSPVFLLPHGSHEGSGLNKLGPSLEEGAPTGSRALSWPQSRWLNSKRDVRIPLSPPESPTTRILGGAKCSPKGKEGGLVICFFHAHQTRSRSNAGPSTCCDRRGVWSKLARERCRNSPRCHFPSFSPYCSRLGFLEVQPPFLGGDGFCSCVGAYSTPLRRTLF